MFAKVRFLRYNGPSGEPVPGTSTVTALQNTRVPIILGRDPPGGFTEYSLPWSSLGNTHPCVLGVLSAAKKGLVLV
jgi:hypothetical protein